MTVQQTTSSPSRSTWLKLWWRTIFGVLTLAGLWIYIRNFSPFTREEKAILTAVFAISLVFLFYEAALKSKLTTTAGRWTVTIVGPFVVIFAFYKLDPMGVYSSTDTLSDRRDVVVALHGPKGTTDKILRQGYLTWDLTSLLRAEINEQGEANFQDVKIGDTGKFAIDFSEPYKVKWSDSAYRVPLKGKIRVEIFLPGLARIEGYVRYQNQPVSGVFVQHRHLSDTTDELGNFMIAVPDSMQREQYSIKIWKPGFKAQSKTYHPQTEKELPVILEKQ